MKWYLDFVETIVNFWFYPGEVLRSKKLPSVWALLISVAISSTLTATSASNAHMSLNTYVWFFIFSFLITTLTTILTTGITTTFALWTHRKNFSSKRLFVAFLMVQTLSFITMALTLIKNVFPEPIIGLALFVVSIWQIILYVKVISFETGLKSSSSFWIYIFSSAYILLWLGVYIIYFLILLSSK